MTNLTERRPLGNGIMIVVYLIFELVYICYLSGLQLALAGIFNESLSNLTIT